MKYELVVFDWDGTLMDSTGKIVQSMGEAARRAELPIPDEHAIRQIIGISLEPAIKRLFELKEADDISLVAQHYKDVFVRLDATPCAFFDGAKSLLGALANTDIRLAVATGKARRGLERAWQQVACKSYFHASRCGDEGPSKPHPDMLVHILNELAISPEKAVMVGDTTWDMDMAHSAGMDSIAVTFGAHEREQLNNSRPTHIIDNFAELKTLLLR